MNSDIIAKINFYNENNGGRKGPTPSSFFNCPMVINNKYYDCRLLLNNIGSIKPGDKVVVPIKFLDSETVLKIITKNDTFTLWESGIIADGKVIEKNE